MARRRQIDPVTFREPNCRQLLGEYHKSRGKTATTMGTDPSRAATRVAHDVSEKKTKQTEKQNAASRVRVVPDSDAGLRLLDLLERVNQAQIEAQSDKSA
jgi:hypothetical protein